MSKTVLITGGSSGIGLGLSKKFAADGFQILWASLIPEEIERAKAEMRNEFQGIDIQSMSVDLSKNLTPQKVYEWAKSVGNVDVLVNNAGFGTYGYLNDIDMSRELDMINLNVIALYKLTRLFLKDMIQMNSGTIINISSNSSFETVPRLLTYSSTKAFVKHFTRGLSEELKMQGSNVKAITICPAAINDTAFKTSGAMETVTTFNEGIATTTKDEVVGDIWKAYKKGQSFKVTGWKMRWLYALNSFVPYWFHMFLTRRETEKK